MAALRQRLLSRDSLRGSRHEMLAKMLAGRRRVLDLDATDGKLLEFLALLKIPGVGMTDTPELAAEARARSIDIRVQTLGELLRSLEPGEFDAVVAERLADRLSDMELRMLIRAIHDMLPDGGIAIFTARNPAIITPVLKLPEEVSRHPELLTFWLDRAFSKVETFDGPRDRPAFIEGTQPSDTDPLVRTLSSVVAHNAEILNRIVGGPPDLLVRAVK